MSGYCSKAGQTSETDPTKGPGGESAASEKGSTSATVTPTPFSLTPG